MQKKNRLQAVVIGDLTGIKFNYLAWSNSFFMSYVTNKHTKTWYQLWKYKNLIYRKTYEFSRRHRTTTRTFLG